MADDPDLRGVVAKQAYGPIYSSQYADAMKSARANELARSWGLPHDIVEASMPDLLAADRVKKRMAEAERNTAYARIMSNTRLAAAAIDDDHLPQVARKIDEHKEAETDRRLLNVAAPGSFQVGVLGRLLSGTAGLAEGALGLVRMLGERAGPSLPWPLAPIAMAGAAAGKGPSQAMRQLGDATRYETTSRNTNDILSGVESVPASLGALGVTVLTGNPLAGATVLGMATGGQSYNTARDEGGLTPQDATIYAGTDAAIETGTELLPEKFLGKWLGGGGMAKNVAKFFGVELGGEVAATALQGLNRWYWIDRAKGQSFSDFLKTLPDQERSTVVATMATMGITAGAGYVAQDVAKRHFDKVSAQRVHSIMDAAGQSPTRAANPSDFEEALNQLVGDTVVEHLYIPAEEVFKQFEGDDAKPISEDPFWSKYQAQLDEAKTLGGDVVIPLASAATHLAGTPQWDAIKDHVRVSAGGASITEAKQKQSPEELERMAAEISGVVEQAVPRMQRVQAIEAVKGFAASLGYEGEQADLISRYIANAMLTRYQEATAEAVAKDEAPPSIAEFAQGWLPQAQRMAQAEYDRAGAANTFGQEHVRDVEPLSGMGETARQEVYQVRPARSSDVLAIAGGSDVDVRASNILTRSRRVTDGSGQRTTTPEFLGEDGNWYPLTELAKIGGARYFANENEALDALSGEFDVQATPQGPGSDQAAAGEVRDRRGLPGSAELLDAAARAQLGLDEPLPGAPKRLTIPGRGKVVVGRFRPAVQAAADYMRNVSWRHPAPPARYAKLDEARAKRIANVFHEAKSEPNAPLVKMAYKAMIEETLAQFQVIKATGLHIEFIRDGQGDPYADSPRLAIQDVVENNHLWVFPTTGGFGQGEVANSPMLELTNEVVDGRILLANDVFRIVHDYFGHIKDGHGFRAEGEENAWQSHAAMYSPLARRAMTTETRGQNSWLNYGPEGEENRTASSAETTYAPQKVTLLPLWASEEGFVANEQEEDTVAAATEDRREGTVEARSFRDDQDGTQGDEGSGTELTSPPVVDGMVVLHHFSKADLSQTDPSLWGQGKAFYSRSEREYMSRAPARTYFGIATNRPGGYKLEFSGRQAYRAKLPIERLYDVGADPDVLWVRGRPEEGEQRIKDYGYAGYWHKNPELGLVAVVFEPVDVEPIARQEQTFNQAAEPPGFARAAPFLADEEKAGMRAASMAKLLSILDDLPDPEEAAAVAYAGRAKKGWYARSAQAIVDVFGLNDAPRFAALLAALSPQVSVEANLYNALKIWTNWNNAGRPTDRQTIVQIMGDSVLGKKGTASVLNAWINNSVTALTTPDAQAIKLSGPKVNSFMANLMGVVDEVTNDTWMARYAGLSVMSSGGKTKKDVVYKAMNVVIRQAAQIATERTGQTWEPMEIQETVWSFAKTLYEMAQSDPEGRLTTDLLAAAELTHAQIANTVDFATLFSDGIFRLILEEGGYGEQISNLESSGRAAPFDGSAEPVTDAEGSGFTQPDFDRFLQQAAARFGRDLELRRAKRDTSQGELTLNQAVTPSEETFYSNAERVVEEKGQPKASAEQWVALLTPGRTPGIKAEEIEWTGIIDWLKMQKGQIEKDALLQVLRDRGIQVEENILGEPEHIYKSRASYDDEGGYYVYDGDMNVVEGPFTDPDEADERANELTNEAEVSGVGEPKFQSWSSDPSNPTYRELLITLPLGEGSNPNRAADTHWNEEGVVAHARFMEKTDADGKRVLFIEEVQSDWHQKGRDQGYESEPNPEAVAKVAALEENARATGQALAETRAEIDEVAKKATELAGPILLAEYNRQVADIEERAKTNDKLTPEAVAAFKEVMRAQMGVNFYKHRGDDGGFVSAEQVENWLGTASFSSDTMPEEIAGVLKDAERLRKEQRDLDRRMGLYRNELSQAKSALKKGIPDAPFKTSWPALVMKRMIRWAVDNGFERVAWTTGEEQASRYNLSSAVGRLYHDGMQDGEGHRIGMFGSAAQHLANNGLGTIVERDGEYSIVRMTEGQAREAFGSDIANKLIEGGQGTKLDDEADLRVGGEGMKAFYDRNLVNITNDIIKKYGAKVGPVDVVMDKSRSAETRAERRARVEDAIAGLGPDVPAERRARYEQTLAEIDAEPVGGIGVPQLGFEITPQLADAASSGFALFQQKRGNISIRPGDDGLMRSALIRAFEAANFSTAIHELGHFFLEDLKRRALVSGATPQAQADWATFKQWASELGHEISDSGGIPVEAHEYFARGMERFVWEGNAPSRGLRAIFTRMRDFMVDLYKTASAFNAPITPEIRQVMGRILASQDEIDAQHAELEQNRQAIKGLLTEDEAAAYDALAEESRQDARDKMFEKVLSALKQEKMAAYRDRRDAIRQEVAGEIDNQPVYRALKLLRVGIPGDNGNHIKARLSRQWLQDNYGDIETQLPGGVPPIVSDNDAIDPELLAEMAGFDSADAMIQRLLEVEAERQQLKASGDKRSPRMRALDEEASARLRDEIGDPLVGLEEEAQAALANDRQAELMSMELRALARKAARKPTPWKLATQWARERVRAATTSDAITGNAIQMYSRNAQKAARAAEEALVKGDFELAFQHKQQQLLNSALTQEAKRAKDDVDAAVKRMQKLAKRATIRSVDQDYLEQAHALMEDVDLKQRSSTQVAKREAFAAWHATQVAQGIQPIVPPSFKEELGQTHWTKLPIAELLELDRAVGQIVELGRLKQRLKDGKAERDYDEAVTEMRETALQQPQRTSSKTTDEARNLPARIRSALRSADAAMLKIEQLCQWLDGEQHNGPWARMLYGVMAEAGGRETDLLRTYASDINAIIKGLPRATVRSWTRSVDTPELVIRNAEHLDAGQPFRGTKDQVVMMALNWGNEGNRQRLLDGFGWTEQAMQVVLDRTMTKDDWEFVQKVWDTIDKLWPEVAALEKRVNGIAPEKVEPTAIATKHGVYKGGYFPVVYDPTQSTRSAVFEDDKLSPQGGLMQVATRSSATKARAEAVKGRPLRLDLGVVTSHLGEVIHDVTHREAVVQVRKLLTDPRIASAIRTRLGPEYVKAFGAWLENIATPNVAYSKDAPALVALGRHLNKGISLVGLGFRVSTVFMQVLGLPSIAAEIGTKHLSYGVMLATRHPLRTYREITQRSAEMRARWDTLDASIEDMARQQASGKLQTIGPKGIAKYAFQGIAYMDMVVTTAGWAGAFNKGLADGMTEEEATAFADKVIRTTQGAGSMKDRSRILNAHPIVRSLYPFFSYLNALYNMQRDVARRARTAENLGDVADAARRAWWVMVVPLLLQAVAFGDGPPDDEDDGAGWAEYLVKSVILGNLGSLPVIGNLANALGNGYGYRSSAYQQVGEGITKGYKDMADVVTGEDELKGSTIKSVVATAGIVTAQPLGQVGATAGGLYDYSTGAQNPEDAGDWYELLTKGRVSKSPTAAEQLLGEK